MGFGRLRHRGATQTPQSTMSGRPRANLSYYDVLCQLPALARLGAAVIFLPFARRQQASHRTGISTDERGTAGAHSVSTAPLELFAASKAVGLTRWLAAKKAGLA